MMNSIKGISVIVPVYNTAEYLARCIKSITDQDYLDMEIILVDDGSTDESLELCRCFAKDDSRIMVIHKENGGSTSARKAGLAASTKEYVIFADSDDWIEPDFYGKLVAVAKESGVDVVIGGHVNDGWDCGPNVWKIASASCFRRGCYEKQDLNNAFFSHMIYAGYGYFEWGIPSSLCDKLFKKAALAPYLMDMDERVWDGEDAGCTYPALLRVASLYITDICGYHHVMRQASLCHIHDVSYFQRLKYLQECLIRQVKGSTCEDVILPQIDRFVFEMALKNTEMFYGFHFRFSSPAYLFPFEKIPCGSRIVLYGAGAVGREFYRQLTHGRYAVVAAWVDRNYEELDLEWIEPPDILCKTLFDYVVIAVKSPRDSKEIAEKLILEFRVAKEKIIALNSYVYKENYGVKEMGF